MSRTPRERHLAPTPWWRVVLCCGVPLVTAAGCTLTTPTPPPTAPAPVSSTFPEMTGAELDRSLRSGAQGGESSLPPFGQLLASTENGGPTTISFDTAGLDSEIVGVFVCSGEGPGPEVSVTRGDTSLLWFKAEGCDPGNLYSGQSQPVRGSGAATVRVTTPPGMRYSLVLEQVTKG
jgi:hypothetical protein